MKYLLFLLALPTFAQTFTLPNATPLPWPVYQFVDNNGRPLAGAYMCSFIAGTSTPQATYSDATATHANTNPMKLDASGRITIFGGPYLYKLVLYKGTQLTCPSTDTVIEQADQFGDTAAIFTNYISSISNIALFVYNGPNNGTGIPLTTFLDKTIDPRNFGAVGVTGNCKISSVDDAPAIQAALIYAYANGPLDVTLPDGMCWPIGSHVWVPPGVHFHGGGRNTGYENSEGGALLIANTFYGTTNSTFPYSQMVWMTGDNFTVGTPYLASNVTFGSKVYDMEINCASQVGCGNLLGVGRQEKSSFHDLILTGSVPFSGGLSFGFYEPGVDCNNRTPPDGGCLIAKSASAVVANPFSGQQGPDYNLEIFPSYENAQSNFIPFALMGAANYKGLKDSTINCDGIGIPYGEYAWGSDMRFEGVHTEGCGVLSSENTGMYLGNIPSGSTCIGADNSVFIDNDAPVTIPAGCSAETRLTFINQGHNYNSDNVSIHNNVAFAPVPLVTEANYYYDSQSQASGPIGVQNGYYANTNILLTDPGTYYQIGYGHFSAYNGNPQSGWNAGQANELAGANIRGYSCGNLYWIHATGLWTEGGDGALDYSCVLHLNQGGIGLAEAQAPVGGGNTINSAGLLNSTRLVVSGITGNVLAGLNWLNLSTGNVQGEGTAGFQVHGGLGGDTQWATTPGCNTTNTAGNTCQTTITWHNPYATTNYFATCTGSGITGFPIPQGIVNVSPTGVVFQTTNGTASEAQVSGYANITCWAGPNVY